MSEDDDTKIDEQRLCTLSVYSMGRSYGGPEEGGWYYTTYEYMGGTPFVGKVEFMWHAFDPDDPNDREVEGDMALHEDEHGDLGCWRDRKIFEVDQRWLLDETRRLLLIFTGEWQVVEASKEPGDLLVYVNREIMIVKETNPGWYAKRPRPRYC